MNVKEFEYPIANVYTVRPDTRNFFRIRTQAVITNTQKTYLQAKILYGIEC